MDLVTLYTASPALRSIAVDAYFAGYGRDHLQALRYDAFTVVWGRP